MLYTIVGPNEFAMKHSLVSLFKQQNLHPKDVEKIDCSEITYPELIEKLSAQSLFVSTRGFVLKFISQNKTLVDEFSENIDNLPDETIVIYEPQIDRRSKLYKALKKTKNFKDHPQLNEFELARWLVAEAEKSGAKLSRQHANKIVQMVGDNQQILANELEKLVSFNPEITEETIKAVVNEDPKETIFQLLDSLVSSEPQESLDLYRNLRLQQMEPAYILSMVVWHAHNLLLIKSAQTDSEQEIVQSTKLSPFVVKKNKKLAQSISMDDFRTMYKSIVETDRKIKTSSVNSDLVMEQLITKLAQSF